MPRPVPSSTRAERQLVAAAPLRKLRDEWAAEASIRARRSERSAELDVMRSMIAELEAALAAAIESDAWGSVSDAHAATGVPESTIRRWCKLHGEACGASRPDGQKDYVLDLRRFEAFALANRKEPTEARTTPDDSPAQPEGPRKTTAHDQLKAA